MINSKGIRINFQLNRINRKTGKRIMINDESLRMEELYRIAEMHANKN